MPTFDYTGRTRKGDRISGSISAVSRQMALSQIDKLGHLPVSVNQVGGGSGEETVAAFTPFKARKMRTRELLQFTTELSDLLASGMQLGQALGVLAGRKTGKAGDDIIAAMRDSIVQGASLSDAMEEHPRSFPGLYTSLIRAGESSGALPEVLMRLVDHYERIQGVKDQVLMAMVYPMFVMFMGGVIIVFLMTSIIPQFAEIFDELGSTLPLPTRILRLISESFVLYGWVGALILIAGTVAFLKYIRTESGRFKWHSLLLRTPVLRNIVAASSFAQFSRIFGTLLSNGVHALPALRIVETTIENVVIVREIKRAREQVTDGSSIAGPLAEGGVFPPLLTDMLSVGEQTGNIANSLTHISKRYESDLDRSIKLFTTILEPVFLLWIAVIVGFVAYSIFSAVQEMTNGLGA